MPQMSGVDLARAAERLRPSLLVIFMSGYVMELEDLAAVGGSLLQKSWRPQQLISEIENRLGRQRG
jgi:CheY-like chemotaxis protein